MQGIDVLIVHVVVVQTRMRVGNLTLLVPPAGGAPLSHLPNRPAAEAGLELPAGRLRQEPVAAWENAPQVQPMNTMSVVAEVYPDMSLVSVVTANIIGTGPPAINQMVRAALPLKRPYPVPEEKSFIMENAIPSGVAPLAVVAKAAVPMTAAAACVRNHVPRKKKPP